MAQPYEPARPASTYLFDADESDRIHAAEGLLDGGSVRLLDALGVGPGWTCLEAGAGGGSIATWLAERVGPAGSVVATDLDVRWLEPIATSTLEVRRHDVVHDPLEEDHFDLVHARLFLEHLTERDAVLDKLVASLRPGGWILVESVDYVSAVPVSELGAALHRRTQAVRLERFASHGVDFQLGRGLPAKLRAAGLSEVGNEGRVFVMEGGSPGASWFKISMAHLRPRLVGPDGLTDQEVDEMLDLFDDPEWSAFTPVIVACWGRRPTEP